MKHTTYIMVILATALLFSCGSKTEVPAAKKEFAHLKPRTGELARTEEWKAVQLKEQKLFQKIYADSSDIKSKLLLAQLFMAEARITGEHPYYYPAVLTILDDVLLLDSMSFEALAFKASVQLSLHQFDAALETGIKAKKLNGNNGFIYGVLCDANVELGQYSEAVRMSDFMQSIRPGLESYARASYLREIHGDNQGAIEAMTMAFKAGLAGTEEACWAGYTLGKLYENTGDLQNAEAVYNTVLQQRPSYAFAIAGLGSIEKNKGNHKGAISLYEKAAKIIPEVSFYEEMAECYASMGNKGKSQELFKKSIAMLQEDASSGHMVDMELAKIYSQTGDLNKALQFATKEHKRRPENIDVNATLAWVLYQKGNYADAWTYMQKATRLGTQNADLLARSGRIQSAAGMEKAGKELLVKAKRINPYSSYLKEDKSST
jgi:tetratricopeptide (TPR) repeat protein